MMGDADERRPDIETIGESTELRRWYWLKEELVVEARRVGVGTTGSKFAILDRLAHFLDTGETVYPGDVARPRPSSKFDWRNAVLSLDTVITDNYKNTQNVRHFFESHAGAGFKFSIALMEWMQHSIGRTLDEAVAEYRRLERAESEPGHRTEIKDHNQFNQYTRDFLEDHPDLGMDDVRRVWRLKTMRPSDDGRHVYEQTDLDLTEPDRVVRPSRHDVAESAPDA